MVGRSLVEVSGSVKEQSSPPLKLKQ